jgi:hypothetical protein
MYKCPTRDETRDDGAHPPAGRSRRVAVIGGFAIVGALSLLTGAVSPGQEAAAPQGNPEEPYLISQTNQLPDANDQMKMRGQNEKQVSFDASNAERKKELSDESAQLLTLAMALKAEVDKTNKDMLSLNVVRKADEIEKLAHNVRTKMKLTAGE